MTALFASAALRRSIRAGVEVIFGVRDPFAAGEAKHDARLPGRRFWRLRS
jgi:hypothetical protein